MQVPLEWKLSVSGDGQVKSVMNDLRSAFDRGQISGSDYADSMSKIGREANKVNNISRYQNQIFLSMHPNINKLSRGFSMFASVARTTLSLMTSINTLMIAQNTQSSALSEITGDMAENRRELNRTLDPERIQKLNEEYAVLLAREKELKDQDNVTYWESWLNAIIGAGLYLNIFKNHLFKIIPALGGIKGLGIGGIFAAIAVAVAFAAEEMYKFLFGIKDMDAWRAENVKGLINFFTVSIPNAIKIGWSAISKFFLTDLPIFAITGFNIIIKAFTDFINWIIGGINMAISGLNKLTGVKISPIQKITTSLIPLPSNSNPIQGPGQPARSGDTYITVEGSVITERQLMGLVDDKFKEWMKSRGFTGFQ